MLVTPAGLTVVTFLSLRMRPEALRPVKWRLAEWPRRILPPAVILKRLRAPRCVFSFILGLDAFLGIAKPFLWPLQLSVRERDFLTPHRLHETGSEFSTGRSKANCAAKRSGYCACWAPELVCPTTRVAAPFLGARSVTRTLPSMRGMVSICPCS